MSGWTLEDGTVYPVIGTLKFTDVTVDPTTGSQAIRAVFQNPQKLLLPGMFVRAELIEGTKIRGMLVPQQAVTRDDRGQATVSVVGPDSKLQSRTIQATRTIGTNWLVTSGVRAGDRIVIHGRARVAGGHDRQGGAVAAGRRDARHAQTRTPRTRQIAHVPLFHRPAHLRMG